LATNPDKDLNDDLAAVRADVAALSDTVSKLAAEALKAQAAFAKDVKKAAQAAGRVGEEAWDETMQLGSDAAETVTDAAQAGMDSLENQIRQKPFNAVLIALGIGFVVGFLGRK
jgi:ElaB/YqjD/DUF883 family membrane-anchored ribosome-binding protein